MITDSIASPISLSQKSEGLFRIETRRGEGEWFERACFHNLITDAGLAQWGDTSGSRYWRCGVGSGSAVPTPADTGLQTPVAFVNNTSQPSGIATGAPEYGRGVRQVFTFGVGAVVANISEVCVGINNESLPVWSRALILDALGNPTSITILSDEQLRVTYEHMNYPPLDDITGEFELTGNLGGVYSFTARAAMVTDVNFWNPANSQSVRIGVPVVNNTNGAANGTLGPITGRPSNTGVIGTRGSGTGTGTTRNFTDSFSVSQGNVAGGINTYLIQMGAGGYQFEFDPPIMKTNQDTLSLTFSHSWGRR